MAGSVGARVEGGGQCRRGEVGDSECGGIDGSDSDSGGAASQQPRPVINQKRSKSRVLSPSMSSLLVNYALFSPELGGKFFATFCQHPISLPRCEEGGRGLAACQKGRLGGDRCDKIFG